MENATESVATDQTPDTLFSLTRMIYAVGGAITLYQALGLAVWLVWKNVYDAHDGRSLELWLYGTAVLFALTMLIAVIPYRPKKELLRWPIRTSVPGLGMSIVWGLGGGLAAFVAAAPIFWFGDKDLRKVSMLIAQALSVLGVLELLVYVLAVAISSELVFRGILFRTLAGYASVPASVIASSLLFAVACPVLSYPGAIILGVVSAVLFYKTRNLLAPVIANVLMVLGGGGIMLCRGLMRG